MALGNEMDGQKAGKENDRNGGPRADAIKPGERLAPTRRILIEIEPTNGHD